MYNVEKKMIKTQVIEKYHNKLLKIIFQLIFIFFFFCSSITRWIVNIRDFKLTILCNVLTDYMIFLIYTRKKYMYKAVFFSIRSNMAIIDKNTSLLLFAGFFSFCRPLSRLILLNNTISRPWKSITCFYLLLKHHVRCVI